ncbi:hypothetical protein J32TS2_08920 [Shouchella clausii]|nr:hypothetical protein J32TS2_08920 [Shouchella clausii]
MGFANGNLNVTGVVFDVSEADYYELIFEEILLSGQAIWEIPNE